MITLITIIHVVACLFLAIIVLLQHGKGADVGATFGGASQTIFGARGAATLLSKLTAGAAVTFMCTSLGLAYLSSSTSSSSLFSGKTPNPVVSPVAVTPNSTGTPATSSTLAPASTPTPVSSPASPSKTN